MWSGVGWTFGGLIAAAFLLRLITPVFDLRRRDALRRIVKDGADALREGGVDYWCDFGTLLGLHREHDIILGDKDADFCVLAPEKDRLLSLRDAFAKRGLDIEEVKDRKGGLLRILDRTSPHYIDVYLFEREGDLLRSVLNSPHENVPERLVTPRALSPFLGGHVMAPIDALGLLVHRYGPDFMTPRRNDKGRSRPYNPIRSFAEDIEHTCIGIWGLVRLRRAR